MTFLEIKTQVARKCGLLNYAGAYVDGMVSETDLEDLINTRYREMFVQIAEKYPYMFEVEGIFDTVASQAQYTLSGDASDIYELKYVGIKFNSTDTDYSEVDRIEFDIAHPDKINTDLFSEANPKYYRTAAKSSVDGALTDSIVFLPVPATTVTNGGYIRYLETPAKMTSDTHTPSMLPLTAHSLLVEKVIPDIWEIKGDWARSDKALNRFIFDEERFYKDYQPIASGKPARVQLNRVFNPFNRPV
jgi:hypothetical protein